jgi:type I restriction enzyme S subunit
VKNEKGWEKFEFKKFGKISTGNTPSRADEENYNYNFIEWIKTDNIKEHEFYISQAQEYLSEKGAIKGRIVGKDTLLVTCIAGSLQSIGRAAVTNHKVAFNQQINAIEPNENVHISFLYYLVKQSRKYIQDHASSGMKRMLTKGEFEKIKMILPPIHLQNQFAERVQAIETQKQQAQLALAKSEELFGSLLQRAFKGELN